MNNALFSLAGTWKVRLADGSRRVMTLPGTLDENRIGSRDAGANQWHADDASGNGGPFGPDAPIATRLTRRFTYEGPAWLSRTVDFEPQPGTRVFLEAERARCLRLFVDGQEVPDYVEPSISTPRVFEVTGRLHRGAELTLVSDNSYPGLPHDAIVYSSAATDETQTNWNGVLGYIRLRVERPVFLDAVRVYPRGDAVWVKAVVSAASPFRGTLKLRSAALAREHLLGVDLPAGVSCVEAGPLALTADVRRWDEYEGSLYELTAELEGCGEKTVSFGVRDFSDDGTGRLALNGRRVFIRSEANCAEFPETGHPPMTVEAWTEALLTYKAYGVNMVRFHSHCPPEAAFDAADRLGMLMEPELSHWNPRDAFEAEDAWRYYRVELRRVIETLANHPSFVMLTLGNELATGATGLSRMGQLLDMARTLDGTRLYASGSNNFYGARGCDPGSDFYTSSNYYDAPLRGIFAGTQESGGALPGHINGRYPSASFNYEAGMARLREAYAGPVFGFEVGQFEVLPDFDELADFRGVTDPANLRLVRDRAIANGLEADWKRRVEASGELSRLCYREEVEAVMRTPSMSGLSLLGLQDFPGQGTALVGMLNSHLKPKPFGFARPERFRAFFRAQLPLALLEKYTYCADEALRAPVVVANYGRQAIAGPVRYALRGVGFAAEGALEAVDFPAGGLTAAGVISVPLGTITSAARLDLTLSVGETGNSYPVWVYPPTTPECPEDVLTAERFDARAVEALQAGGKVFLAPESTAEALPASVRAQFSTDFWSVGTFPCQSGTMGQLIDEGHPLFKRFPTEFHTNWQWWPMATQRAVILPRPIRAIVAELDSYAAMRPMAQLFECRCGGGRLLFCSMGLAGLQQYPEARALLDAIYRYMASEDFAPQETLSPEEIAALVQRNASPCAKQD